ncbi:MAG: DinB family protein [Paracoccaceae bacterium]
MISPEYCQELARYNAWQNRSLYREADVVGDAARRLDRGAFFGSIQATLSHILWGDMMWMYRLNGWDKPGAHEMEDDWEALKERRFDLDARILVWVNGLEQSDLEGPMSWHSSFEKTEFEHPKWVLVTHVFNHQTHHRGQVHAMLTAAGGKPDATDLPFMPVEV